MAIVPLHKRAVKGGFVGVLSLMVNLLLNLAQVPLVLQYWPQDTYGLWLSIGALSALLTVFDGGHQSYVGNILNNDFVSDLDKFRRTLGSATRVVAVTATLQVLIAAYLSIASLLPGSQQIPFAQATDFRIALVVYVAGWALTGSFGSIIVRLLIPTGGFVTSTMFAIGMRIAQVGSLMIAARFSNSLTVAAFISSITVTLYSLWMLGRLRSLHPEFYPWWAKGSFRVGLRNLFHSLTLTCSLVLEMLSTHGSVLIVASAVNAPAAALFTTLRTLANTTTQAAGLIMNPLQPDLVRYHLVRNGKLLMAIASVFWLGTGIVLNGLAIAGLYIVEKAFSIWTGGNLYLDRELYGWIAAAALIRVWASPLNAYILAINNTKGLLILSIVKGAIVVVGGVGLAKSHGVAGVGVALFVSELLGNAVLSCVQVARILKANGMSAGWREPLVAAASLAFGVTALVSFGYSSRWSEWAIIAIVGICTVALVQWLLLPVEIRSKAKTMMGRLFTSTNRPTPL